MGGTDGHRPVGGRAGFAHDGEGRDASAPKRSFADAGRTSVRRFSGGLRLMALLGAAALLGACSGFGDVVPNAATTDVITVETLALDAAGVSPQPLRVRVWLPPGYASGRERYPVLYALDGQDMEAVGLETTLARLYATGRIRPVIVVAVDMPPDRLAAYGLSDRVRAAGRVAQTRFGAVGANAHLHAEWVANVLVPTVDAGYRTVARPDARAILGWSLGALHAFGLGWQYPDVFGRVGAFSPSFWLAGNHGDAKSVQRTRLALRMVDADAPRMGARYFFAVGAHEEEDDRDGDGVNDALDDTRDLIEGWSASSDVRLKGLRQQGYSVNLDHADRPGRKDVSLFVLDDGRHHQASWARMLPVFLEWAYARRAPALDATGHVESWHDFPSHHVALRDIDVWLPPGYADNPGRRYPVLYMHDGQNLFDPALSYTGIDWGVDETMTRLVADGRVRGAIVVGIWNTPRRFAEYMPRKAVKGEALASGAAHVPPLPVAEIRSDDYLRFLVEELKPFVDRTYRTRRGPDHTYLMGSSMGGLISLYAAAEYPAVFGGVGAVSTHWPAGDGAMIDWLDAHLPPPGRHRFYFDHGTATLDASYVPYQRRMDAVMRAHGYIEGRDWITRRFEGAEHNERAWRERLEIPLEFLLRR